MFKLNVDVQRPVASLHNVTIMYCVTIKGEGKDRLSLSPILVAYVCVFVYVYMLTKST